MSFWSMLLMTELSGQKSRSGFVRYHRGMERFDEVDTIAAISTPLGEGGIGVVRVSGPRAWEAAGRVFRSASGMEPETFASHTAHYGRVVDPEPGESIDQCVWLGFRAPRSYTGED